MSVARFVLPSLLLTAFLAVPTFILTGCSPAQNDALVATVGKDQIRLSEYEKQYLKNSSTREDAAKTGSEERQRFLNLLVNYRLKLNDAYQSGLDRRPDIAGELAQYKGNLAASFLTEREIVAPGVRRLYDQRREEIRAKHIMISLRPKAAPDDSAAAYAKAYKIIGMLKAGADFDSLALVYSDDPSARANKGDLYYFTAGNMVPPFEEAAFAMKVGETSSVPVRTQYGLHILRITDREPSKGEIRCSHIMIQFSRTNAAGQDTVAPYAKILAVKDSLNAGGDFAELAKRNSTDGGSASKGGDLGWFVRRRWVQPFDEMAFRLKPGEVSPIVRTAYGYHIIKCTETRPPKTFEQAKDEVKQLYQQTRFKDDYAAYVGRLKQQLQFRMVDSTVNRFIASLDTNKTTADTGWASTILPGFGRAPMMFVGQIPTTVDSVIALIKSRPDLGNVPLRAPQMQSLLDKVSEHIVFTARAASLEKENPEFASIIREYQEGMLLYQIEQERVWNRIQPNDSLLHAYFDAHRDRFVYPDRLNITELRSGSEVAIKEFVRHLDAGATMEQAAIEDSLRMNAPKSVALQFKGSSASVSRETQKALAHIGTEAGADPATRITLVAHPDTSRNKAKQTDLAGKRMKALASFLTKTYGIPEGRILQTTKPLAATTAQTKSTAQTIDAEISGRIPLVIGRPLTSLVPVKSDDRTNVADSLAPGSVSKPFLFKGSWMIVRLNGRDASRQKTFEEAGPEVSSAFQESESKRLEDDWLSNLRRQYPVTEHTDVLGQAFAPQR